MKLSIIIPHYNNVQGLKNLFSTIPVHEEIEILVCDDKSEENAQEEAKSFIESTPHQAKFILNQTTNRKGPGPARNIALEYATGQWVLFADSDDLFADGFYDIVSSYFESENDIVYFKPASIDLNSGEESDRHVFYEENVMNYINEPTRVNELNLRFNFAPPWSKLIRRRVIEIHSIRFPDRKVGQDLVFSTILALKVGKIAADERNIYIVTRNDASITSQMTKETYMLRFSLQEWKTHYLRAHLGEEFPLLQMNFYWILRVAATNHFGKLFLLKLIFRIKKQGFDTGEKAFGKGIYKQLYRDLQSPIESAFKF